MGSSGGQKRIGKELVECMKDPPSGTKVELLNESNIYKWIITMDGPEQSAYQGGRFVLLLSLPTDYPFKPPVLAFQTRIYHPNVSNDDKGSMCLGMLRSDEWKPPNKILAVLNMVKNILIEPNVDDAVETGIADQYKNSRNDFNAAAKNHVKQYAKK